MGGRLVDPKSHARHQHDEGKTKRKKKVPCSVQFSGVKFGGWSYPSEDRNHSEGGLFEASLSFPVAGGKLSYSFPFSSGPGADRALIEFPLSSVVATELDEEAGSLTVLLSSPPSTYVGQLIARQQVPEGQPTELTANAHFDTQQADFSAGPVKTYRCHTLFLGPSGAGLPGSKGRNGRVRSAVLAAWGARGSSIAPSALARKLLNALCQDEAFAFVLEQERQCEPGGSFPAQEIEASLRPVVPADAFAKPTRTKRRASAVDIMDDDDDDMGTPKRKKTYKSRASASALAAAGGAPTMTPPGANLSFGAGGPGFLPGLRLPVQHALELGVRRF